MLALSFGLANIESSGIGQSMNGDKGKNIEKVRCDML